MTHWSGIAFLFEELLPPVIGRPSAVAPVIPACDPLIRSRSKRDAIGHCATPLIFQKACCRIHAIFNSWPPRIVAPLDRSSSKQHFHPGQHERRCRKAPRAMRGAPGPSVRGCHHTSLAAASARSARRRRYELKDIGGPGAGFAAGIASVYVDWWLQSAGRSAWHARIRL
jgi:hypothetical protein